MLTRTPPRRRNAGPIVLVLLVLLILGGIYFLSTVPKEQPTKTVEVEVSPGGNAQ